MFRTAVCKRDIHFSTFDTNNIFPFLSNFVATITARGSICVVSSPPQILTSFLILGEVLWPSTDLELDCLVYNLANLPQVFHLKNGT